MNSRELKVVVLGSGGVGKVIKMEAILCATPFKIRMLAFVVQDSCMVTYYLVIDISYMQYFFKLYF